VRLDHPDQPIPDGQVFVQPTTMGPKADQRQRKIFYQYRIDRAKRSLKGIDTEVAKAERSSPMSRTPPADSTAPPCSTLGSGWSSGQSPPVNRSDRDLRRRLNTLAE
jgi:hypothetical protein